MYNRSQQHRSKSLLSAMQKQNVQFVMHRQRGITLITVMVMLLLAGLMVLGANRVSILNERITGNSMDYQRAFEAAEATLKDAALDLACMRSNCKNRAGLNAPLCEPNDILPTLTALTPTCVNGLCSDLGALTNGDPDTSFWSPNPVHNQMDTYQAVGASFGQFTNAAPVAGTALSPTLLANQARYWIEILPYAGGTQTVAAQAAGLAPALNCSVIFRITAVATGLKPNTTAVVQSLYMFRDDDPTPTTTTATTP